MLVPGKTPKKKIIIYTIIIIAMIIGNIFIYYNNSQKAQFESGDNFVMDLDQELLDFSGQPTISSQSILEHNVFVTLKKIGDWPITPTNVGKTNPFVPLLED
jgi:cbb3-type cytochrome oxidase subunit 3